MRQNWTPLFKQNQWIWYRRNIMNGVLQLGRCHVHKNTTTQHCRESKCSFFQTSIIFLNWAWTTKEHLVEMFKVKGNTDAILFSSLLTLSDVSHSRNVFVLEAKQSSYAALVSKETLWGNTTHGLQFVSFY